VTGMCSPNGSCKNMVGNLCSKISTNMQDDGGVDRFLLPTEQSIFSSCIKNPPGFESGNLYGLVNAKQAVTKHLPRAANDPSKIRVNATLVIIVATDEVPGALHGVIPTTDYGTCTLDAVTQAKVNQAIQPYVDLFQGVTDPEAAAMFHVIGGTCSNPCSAEVAHGYREFAQQLGGQVGDVCQKDLGNTLQTIVDDIVAASSPIKLEYVPISSSLAVMLNGSEIKRSRTNGFDYRASANALVFINVKYKKGSEVIAAYKRWSR